MAAANRVELPGPALLSLPPHNLASDLRGAGRLLFDAGLHVTDLVEAMHGTIAGLAGLLPGSSNERTRGITGLVYRCVGGGMRLAGRGVDSALAPLAARTSSRERPASHAATLAVLNGVLGDHLDATGNPLAIRMSLQHHGRVLELDREAIQAAIPDAGSRVLVQVHGLCMHPRQWARGGHDPMAALAGELGYTRLHLHYNTGLHIAVNGRQLAAMLETLVACWQVPVRELVLVGHSMGGLVARSAAHYGRVAGHAWVERLSKMVFLGTPHHGSPLERAGNGLDSLLGLSPYTRPFTRLGRARSHGITDLRFGILLEEDWRDRDRYAPMREDPRTPVPLPAGVSCYTIAAVLESRAGAPAARLLGDGLVPLGSALGEHKNPRLSLDFPAAHRWVVPGLGHLDLLSSPQVFKRVRHWLQRLEGNPGCEGFSP